MSRKWYGSLNNRVEENRQFCDEIKVGTGMTEYFWSDRHAYEVVEVIDQKHVKVREYDAVKADNESYSNHWNLVSNEKNPVISLTKRGNYWYVVVTCTPEEARAILEKENNLDERLWACHNGFDLQEIANSNKAKTKYHRRNVSFGVANYYYDYEF